LIGTFDVVKITLRNGITLSKTRFGPGLVEPGEVWPYRGTINDLMF